MKGLTAHDAAAVAKILKSNTSVTEVDLRVNKKIRDEGAKALAEALKVNATVKRLDIGGCGIGEQGDQLLRDAVADRQGFELYFLIDEDFCQF